MAVASQTPQDDDFPSEGIIIFLKIYNFFFRQNLPCKKVHCLDRPLSVTDLQKQYATVETHPSDRQQFCQRPVCEGESFPPGLSPRCGLRHTLFS